MRSDHPRYWQRPSPLNILILDYHMAFVLASVERPRLVALDPRLVSPVVGALLYLLKALYTAGVSPLRLALSAATRLSRMKSISLGGTSISGMPSRGSAVSVMMYRGIERSGHRDQPGRLLETRGATHPRHAPGSKSWLVIAFLQAPVYLE